MKKRVALILAIIVSMILAYPLVFAQNDTIDDLEGFDKGYACLEGLLEQIGYPDLTVEDQAFSMLALGYDESIQGKLRSALADSSLDGRCWPSDGCKIKETALALIAMEHINAGTDLIEGWLAEETEIPDELIWFLQIDTSEKASCTISYEGGSKKVTVNQDKRITGAGGECLKSAYNGYWLEIDKDCYDDQLEITCDKAFITALIYRRSFGGGLDAPYYVSAVTNSRAAGGIAQEKVSALCFEEDGQCDYEGTLWATLALRKLNQDTDAYMPYLIALAPANERYFPSAFLFMLTRDDEYLTDLISQQKTGDFWQASTDIKQRNYDTALALLALQGTSSEQKDNAVEYLLDSQQASGCWANARDTAFILYAVEPKEATTTSPLMSCEPTYYCAPSEQDCLDAVGVVMPNYDCPASEGPLSVCCTVDVPEPTIDIDTDDQIDTERDCVYQGYTCKSQCDPDLEELTTLYDCPGFQSCCMPRLTPVAGPSYWWVWLLVILIILLILAIIFRNQVKIWLFRVKSKFKKGSVSAQKRPPTPPMRPGMPPRVMPRYRPRPGMPPRRMPPRSGARGAKEAKLQETLKKLKEIGK